MKTVKMQGEQT